MSIGFILLFAFLVLLRNSFAFDINFFFFILFTICEHLNVQTSVFSWISTGLLSNKLLLQSLDLWIVYDKDF